jgi:hypothetical protein
MSKRLSVTLDDTEAGWLEGQATITGLPIARLAAGLLAAAIRGGGTNGEAAEGGKLKAPREAWPMATILADREWFARWLPEFRQLMGRSTSKALAVDDAGYLDWMATLFPEVASSAGGRRDWLCPDYGHWARIEADRAQEQNRGMVPIRPVRSQVWAPAVRSIVLALCALERAAEPARDPYTAMRIRTEIRTTWKAEFIELIGSAHFAHMTPSGPIA